MPHLTIDQREVEVPPGGTILDAARALGIDIPTLCFLQGCTPSTSCMVCMVKIRQRNRLVPSCATLAEDGMEVESESAEVHEVRKTALELLLSDHVGDCFSPCFFACPAHMDIPLMLRQITAENLPQAIATIKADIALPAVLGRVCSRPCEKACRRTLGDGPVSVCGLKRYVADADLASSEPYLPACQPGTGKRVAIVGAGATGLSAAYYLLQQGHAVVIFDEHDQPGGSLRYSLAEEALPRDVLDAEIAVIARLGAVFQMKTRIGEKPSLAELERDFDAVFIAAGGEAKQVAQPWGLATSPQGIAVDRETYQTNRPGVFAGGNATRKGGMPVRSVADGKGAAVAIGQYLAGQPVAGSGKPFSSRIGRLGEGELEAFLAGASAAPRVYPLEGSPGGLAMADAPVEAYRCLQCGCRAVETCKLKHYADLYGADPGRFKGQRRTFEQHLQHADVVFEPGKCIACGLCVQIAQRAGESLGLAFIGRGFDVRIGVPFNRSIAEGLKKVAAECVAACPTAALAFKDGRHVSETRKAVRK
jgi:ferredoxin